MHDIGGFSLDILQHEEVKIRGDSETILLVVIAFPTQLLQIFEVRTIAQNGVFLGRIHAVYYYEIG